MIKSFASPPKKATLVLAACLKIQAGINPRVNVNEKGDVTD